MSIYNKDGNALSAAYDINGNTLNYTYDVRGEPIYGAVDYTSYSYTDVWTSKGISNTQGFDIYNDMVFWVSKSGNTSADANCYVWNLSDGSQALDSAYITVYSWHGNNLSFDWPTLYASSAYTSNCYINTMTDDYSATLAMTLAFNDESTDCDACIDETDDTILWTLGHTASSSDTSAPYYISKWNLNNLTDNGDETYTPALIQTVSTAQPSNSFYFQGFKMHDGILWYANGYSGSSTGAYVFGVDPDSGDVLYTIDCNTTAEPEGVAWVADESEVGGYALYVGFEGMALRKYSFASVT